MGIHSSRTTFVVALGVLWLAATAGATSVFINEFHYDNVSTDTDERIEVVGPAGTDLTGWKIVLYNGTPSLRSPYGTVVLGGALPDQQGGYGTAFVPFSPIQNGAPDGMALLDPSNSVIQFLSYEGSFVAASGPAAGMVSVDVGVHEPNSTPIGRSLQLAGAGTILSDFTWIGPTGDSFGAVNSAQTFFTPPAVNPFINEIHYDNTGGDTGEFVEIAGLAGTDLRGWSLVLYNGTATQRSPYGTVVLGGLLPDQQAGFGTLGFSRAGIQNGSPDGIALVNPLGRVVEFVSYEGTFLAASGPAAGMTSTDIGVSEGGSTPIGFSLQLTTAGPGGLVWAAPGPHTFGRPNAGQDLTRAIPEPGTLALLAGGLLYVALRRRRRPDGR